MSDDCIAGLCCAACMCCFAAATAATVAEADQIQQREAQRALMARSTQVIVQPVIQQPVITPQTQMIVLDDVRFQAGEIYPSFRISPMFSFLRGYVLLSVDGQVVLKLSANQPCKINVSLLSPGSLLHNSPHGKHEF